MPIYVYACPACAARFEVIQRVTEAPVTACEQCGAEGVRRVIQPANVQLRGSGFHNTDYGKSGPKGYR